MSLPQDEASDYGGVVINPASELGKELLKWEQHQTHLVPRGKSPGNPYVFRMFPKMVYRATERQGKAICIEPMPAPYDFDKPDQFERACLAVETFNRSNQKIVGDESELAVAKNDGWRDSPTDAIAALLDRKRAIADAAAEVAFHAQRMSEQARAELSAADASTDEHVVDVTPQRKRGRPVVKKTHAVTGASV